MPSQAQTIALIQIFDYVTANGVAVANAQVTCVLNQTGATVTSSPTSQVPTDPVQISTTTDGNGYYAFSVPSNNIITPSGSWYIIREPNRTMRVAIPAGAGPFQASANLAT